MFGERCSHFAGSSVGVVGPGILGGSGIPPVVVGGTLDVHSHVWSILGGGNNLSASDVSVQVEGGVVEGSEFASSLHSCNSVPLSANPVATPASPSRVADLPPLAYVSRALLVLVVILSGYP